MRSAFCAIPSARMWSAKSKYVSFRLFRIHLIIRDDCTLWYTFAHSHTSTRERFNQCHGAATSSVASRLLRTPLMCSGYHSWYRFGVVNAHRIPWNFPLIGSHAMYIQELLPAHSCFEIHSNEQFRALNLFKLPLFLHNHNRNRALLCALGTSLDSRVGFRLLCGRMSAH